MNIHRFIAALTVAAASSLGPGAVHMAYAQASSFPAALRPALYQALATDAGYDIGKGGCAEVPKGRLKGCFGTHGISFRAGHAHLALHLAAYGRGTALQPLGPVEPVISGNGARYVHPGVTEWWRVLRVGFEQGFTIARRPHGRGRLMLDLTSSRPAELKGHTLAFGRLRYGKLVVTDADGRTIPAKLEAHGGHILIAVNDADARYPLTVDPLVWVEQSVFAGDGGSEDQFGWSVAVDGNTALVGAYNATVGGNSGQGAVYVFTKSGGTWAQTAKLTAGDGAASDQFGISVALDGTTALIGARNAAGTNPQQGAAYVFSNASGSWTQAAKLTAGDGATGDLFGSSVALHGTTAMVGAPHATLLGQSETGAVYVFSNASGGWTQTQKLEANDASAGEYFGTSVAFDSAYTLVGAPGDNDTSGGLTGLGAVYVFSSSSGNWLKAQKLVEPNAGVDAHYGTSVALDGTNALVGSPGDHAESNVPGAVWAYTESGGTWTLAQVLTAATTVANGQFGWSIALHGTTALIGANNSDTAYLFSFSAGSWGQDQTLVAADGAAGHQFSQAVAFDGITAAAGAPFATVNGHADQGKAYFYSQGNLSLVVSAPGETAPAGSYLMQGIVTNDGAGTSLLLNVTIPVPPAVTVISASSSDGSCDDHAGTLTCVVDPIAGSGGTSAVNVTFGVTGTGGETLDNAAGLVGTEPAVTADATTFVDNPPVVANGSVTVAENASVSGTLGASDPDSGDTLTYSIVTGPAHGTANLNTTTGAVTYTPDSGYVGSDSFTFRAYDGWAYSNTATANITVTPASSGGSGGGGGFGAFALLGLITLLAGQWALRRSCLWLSLRHCAAKTSIPTVNREASMKYRTFVTVVAASLLATMISAQPAFAAPGDLDPGFNSGVPAIIDNNPSSGAAPLAAAINPLNGDILWAGALSFTCIAPCVSGEGMIVAYKPDGTPDPAVSPMALPPSQVGGGEYAFFTAVAVDGQGRILATGFVYGSSTQSLVLARFKPDGTLDTSFGAAGTGIVTNQLNGGAEGAGLALTADKHILVTGAAFNSQGTGTELTVWRFNADGTADAAFGDNGHAQVTAIADTDFDWCSGFSTFSSLQPDGSLIAGCTLANGGPWKLTRLAPDGSVDTGFGTNGLISSSNRELAGLALAPDGGFVISELDTSSSPPPLDIRRYLADGSVDTNFNGGNPVNLGTLPGPATKLPLAIQPDGKIVVSGNGGGNSLSVARLLTNGELDAGFGSSGLAAINFNNIGGNNYTPGATAVLLQGDGKIVVSGYADSSAGSDEAAFVTRVLNDTWDLAPDALSFQDVARAPLGQAVASNAVPVTGVSIGSETNGISVALGTDGLYSTSGSSGPFTGTAGAPTPAWVGPGDSLALEQMTPTAGGTTTTTQVIYGGFWAPNNYSEPLGAAQTTSWKTTTDQPPVAADGTLIDTSGQAASGTLSTTNPSGGTLSFAIVSQPSHGSVTITDAASGAYTYTSNSGYSGPDSFTWKVNDGVTDSNIAKVNATVKPSGLPGGSGSGGGGSFGIFALLSLLGLSFGQWFWGRRRRLRSPGCRSARFRGRPQQIRT